MQPDWDMFHSLHLAAEYHATARAIGGCAIYVSDKPGNHNVELLRKLVLPDETVAYRVATNEIQFFDARDFAKGIVNRLRDPAVAGAELSKHPTSHVAAFVPESKVCGPYFFSG